MSFFFFFNDTATTEIYTLSLHDALPILYIWNQLECVWSSACFHGSWSRLAWIPLRMSFLASALRSEEHTSELQSRLHLVCRLLLEKKKKQRIETRYRVQTSPCDMRRASC